MNLDRTRKETDLLSKEKRESKMEQIVSGDILSEYQNLNYVQSKKIKTLKTQVQYLKFRLSDELYKFANQLEMLKKERIELETDSKENLDSNFALNLISNSYD